MKKILLIEDNDDIRNNAAEILGLSSYEVFVAKNGKEGIDKAISCKPDLIICDIMMPVLDGYAVLHALHKNNELKHTPFIFLTAKAERSDVRRGMESGADDYITKPFGGIELLNAVDRRLKKQEMLKKELSTGIKVLESLVQASQHHTDLNTFTEGRMINRYKKKQLIYLEGNHPNRLYFLLSGKVKIYRSNEEGKEFVTEIAMPGDFIGYVALIENTVYKDSAQAMEASELAIIPKSEFEELLNSNTLVSDRFIKLLAKNIAAREEQLLGIAYNSLRKKVADALIMLQRKFNEKKAPGFAIDLTRENMANFAGTAKESLIRTLGDFRNEKLIDICDDGSIIILNQQKLEHLLN